VSLSLDYHTLSSKFAPPSVAILPTSDHADHVNISPVDLVDLLESDSFTGPQPPHVILASTAVIISLVLLVTFLCIIACLYRRYNNSFRFLRRATKLRVDPDTPIDRPESGTLDNAFTMFNRNFMPNSPGSIKRARDARTSYHRAGDASVHQAPIIRSNSVANVNFAADSATFTRASTANKIRSTAGAGKNVGFIDVHEHDEPPAKRQVPPFKL
jgi:hypothetical protein